MRVPYIHTDLTDEPAQLREQIRRRGWTRADDKHIHDLRELPRYSTNLTEDYYRHRNNLANTINSGTRHKHMNWFRIPR